MVWLLTMPMVWLIIEVSSSKKGTYQMKITVNSEIAHLNKTNVYILAFTTKRGVTRNQGYKYQGQEA